MKLDDYESLINGISELSNEDRIKFEFRKLHMGESVGKSLHVFPTRETSKGTKYYLIIASIQNNKILQEWFIGIRGKVSPTNNCISFSDELATEISLAIDEELDYGY